jgi:hypothetical protein
MLSAVSVDASAPPASAPNISLHLSASLPLRLSASLLLCLSASLPLHLSTSPPLCPASQFVAKVGDKAVTAKDRALDKQCSALMLRICQKYDNLAEVDKLASVARKVDTVKLVMQENVDAALQNCVKLESIEKAAEELQQQAGVFKRNANELKNKMWWKNMKMRMIIAAIVLVILGVIAAIIAVMTQQK